MSNINTMTDYELVKLYEQGNDEAFDILLERYQDYLYAYTLSIASNKEDANDIFQETFVRAIVAIREHRYRNTGKFGAWLVRIAHNMAIDNTRRLATQQTNACDIDASYLVNARRQSEPPHDLLLIEKQQKEIVHNMLSMIPENQQEIVHMHLFDELSFREIAQEKGISINTALGRMRYAMTNLKRIAEKYHIGHMV